MRLGCCVLHQCTPLLLTGCATLQLDSWRVARTGAPEVVWGPGKSPEQIAAIMTSMAETEAVVLATRIPQEVRCPFLAPAGLLHCIWAVLVCCPHQAAHCVAAPLRALSTASHPATALAGSLAAALHGVCAVAALSATLWAPMLIQLSGSLVGPSPMTASNHA